MVELSLRVSALEAAIKHLGVKEEVEKYIDTEYMPF